MKIKKEFTLLKVDAKERTDKNQNKSTYLVINVLDDDLNPCKFFCFRDEIVKSIISDIQNAKALSKVLIDFDLTYNDKIWNCNVDSVLFNY